MALTADDKKAIAEYEQRQSFLEPFRRITQEWAVDTQHKFQKRIREIDLVAEGDLESTWRVSVLARDTGVVVAEFGFDDYGRYHDMRQLEKSDRIPVDKIESWVRSKVDQGRIRYSTLAERLGLSFSDPRVIHDLAYRFARSARFNRKRRRWYNKGKEASVNKLYDELRAAALAIVAEGNKKELTTRTTVVS